jgi:hypothetical protein
MNGRPEDLAEWFFLGNAESYDRVARVSTLGGDFLSVNGEGDLRAAPTVYGAASSAMDPFHALWAIVPR